MPSGGIAAPTGTPITIMIVTTAGHILKASTFTG